MDNEMLAGYALGQDSGNNNNNGCFGNGWEWIWIILLFGLFGWGGNGFGFGGNRGGCGSQCATASDVSDAFNFNQLDNGIRGLERGQCDSTYTLNNSLMSGFHGVDNAVCQLGYQTQQGINSLASQMASCCCDIKGGQKDIEYAVATQASGINNAIQGVRYDMATQACDTRNLIQTSTRDIIDGQNASTRAILDFLTQDKISSLQAENQALKFKASQSEQNAFITANQTAQTAELIRRLGCDTPVAAYWVPSPRCCYDNFHSSGFFNNNGCGCGC